MYTHNCKHYTAILLHCQKRYHGVMIPTAPLALQDGVAVPVVSHHLVHAFMSAARASREMSGRLLLVTVNLHLCLPRYW